MKNYQVGFFWRAGDGAGGTLGCAMAFTLDEATQAYQALTAGGTQDIPPRKTYVLLNKWNVLQWVSFFLSTTAGGPITDTTQFTTDQGVATDFSTEKPNQLVWPSDSTDPRWQQNLQTAEKVIVERGKIKAGTLRLTVFQVIVTAIVVLQQARVNALNAAAISDLKTVLSRLVNKKITDSVALTQYENVLAKYPTLFAH